MPTAPCMFRDGASRPRRTSATGIESGFTLIELLVVVAIVGVVLAVAAVNLWPNDEEVARREAGLVALAIEKARDTAWFGGRPTAVSFEAKGLRGWRLVSDRTWSPDASLDRSLGDVTVTGLAIDGAALPTSQRLVFLSDGFGVPFRIALEIRGVARAIESDAAGSLTVRER